MRYPVAIEPGSETQAFGVVVPDLPDCFSAGDSLDDALNNVEAAILLWIDVALDAGEPLPQPSSLDALRDRHPEWAGWIWAIVHVDPARLDDTVERVNITLPRRVLARLDAAAREAGETRSGYSAASPATVYDFTRVAAEPPEGASWKWGDFQEAAQAAASGAGP